MKKNCFLRNSLRIIVATIFLFITFSGTKEKSLAWYLDTKQLWKEYRGAVEDARKAKRSEICYTLPAITTTGENPRLEWMSGNECKAVLVGSMIAEKTLYKWSGESRVMPEESEQWVTLPYDLEEHLRNIPRCTDSLECRMRILQLLGLPPDRTYDRMVFFYVECDRLFRPTPDCEIDDCQASLEFPDNTPEHYRKWFANNVKSSYKSASPLPWTRLGYTYDWNRARKSVVGPGEFIVHPNTKVWIERNVTIWKWYQEIVQKEPLSATT